MPRRGSVALALTGVALVLLLNFKTPSAAPTLNTGAGGNQPGINGGQSVGTGTGSTTQNGSTQNGSSGGGSGGGSGSGVNTTASGTITGSSVDTPFGPLQVQVVLSGGKISDVQVLQYPSSHGRSVAINQYALPILRQETLQAQSANVNVVSGATYTSEAYMQSLQAALDQAAKG